MANHLDIFNYSFTLSPSPPTRQGFGNPLIIGPLVDNSLGGADTLTFANATEAQAALTGGTINQTMFDRVQTMFLQSGKPSAVKVGAVDLVGAETWAQAFTRIKQADPDFYPVLITSRTAADIVSIATQIEADDSRQFFFQSSDADFLTDGLPAAFSALDAFERTSYIWHDTDAELHDCAWVADRISFNPDERSVAWQALLKGVNGLATPLSSTQQGFLLSTNDGNVAGSLGPAYPLFVSPGQNINGRSCYEILTVDWYKARTQEDLSQLLVNFATFGRKLVVGPSGQVAVKGILQGRLDQGATLESPHFIQGQTRVTEQTITQQDRDAFQLRFKVEAQIAQSARALDIDVFFQNAPLEAV